MKLVLCIDLTVIDITKFGPFGHEIKKPNSMFFELKCKPSNLPVTFLFYFQRHSEKHLKKCCFDLVFDVVNCKGNFKEQAHTA
jgi:hypothetical protein